MRAAVRVMVFLVVPALAPASAAAFGLNDLQGRWRGEGVLALADEPPQRLRCLIRFRDSSGGRSVFSGRCATAQAAQSFVYLLHPLGGGRLRAENRAEPPHELPDEMTGSLHDDAVLTFEASGEAVFELRLEGEQIQFSIQSERGETRGRGEAVLQRQQE